MKDDSMGGYIELKDDLRLAVIANMRSLVN